MSGLRFAYLLALVVWLGGLIVLGAVAAPTAFEVLQTQAASQGRVLAGALFGTTLERFHPLAYGCAAVMAVALVVMALRGPRPRPYAPRLVVIGLMLASQVVVAAPLAQRIQAMQASIAGPIASVPDADPRRTTFARLHGLSNALLLFTVLGGLTLLVWEARERR